jgi:transcriptional regulator with XRE-family HTH domain
MTPDQFRRHREAMGLSYSQFAGHLGVTSADVIRCERHTAPPVDPFVLALAVAYVELQVEATAMLPAPQALAPRSWITSDREVAAAVSA